MTRRIPPLRPFAPGLPVARCVAPSWPVAPGSPERLCGEPARDGVTVMGITCPLCPRHRAEWEWEEEQKV